MSAPLNLTPGEAADLGKFLTLCSQVSKSSGWHFGAYGSVEVKYGDADDKTLRVTWTPESGYCIDEWVGQ